MPKTRPSIAKRTLSVIKHKGVIPFGKEWFSGPKGTSHVPAPKGKSISVNRQAASKPTVRTRGFSMARLDKEMETVGVRLRKLKGDLASLYETLELRPANLAKTVVVDWKSRKYDWLSVGLQQHTIGSLQRHDLKVSAAMDPRLQMACARGQMGLPNPSLASATAEELAVVAKVSNIAAWEAISEVRIGSILGPAGDGTTLVTARIPVSRIEAVRAQACVRSLKSSQPLHPALAATTKEMGCRPADYPAQTAPDGGKGVVVGIVDFGCDFAHQNFRNQDGSTRLLAIWNQSGAADANSPFGYGRLHSAAEINAALAQPDPYGALGYGPDLLPPNQGTHGTHVMDIAAGNGRGTGVAGNAPQADLVFVEVAATDIPWAGPDSTRSSFGDSVQMLEAVKFIFDHAGTRPCVVNLSLGTNGGPHDGTTLVEQGLDALVRAQPNRAVVIAASNSYADGIHAAGTVPAGGTYDLVWQSPTGQANRELEIWLPGAAQLAAEIFAPDGTSLGIAEPASNLTLADAGQLAVFASNRLAEPNNGDNTISIYLEGGVPGGDWTLRLHSRNGVAAPFHAWVERRDGAQSHFVAPLDNTHTIGSISCGHETIAVGSFDAHKTGRPLSYFSSAGPTRDGRQKPEVSAPGHGVVAARSRSGNGTTLMSGTSMAAPAVTGLVALLLAEAHRLNLKLTSAQIRDALIKSARLNPPNHAAGAWDPRYGHGRAHISALAMIGGAPVPSTVPAPPPAPRRKPARRKPGNR